MIQVVKSQINSVADAKTIARILKVNHAGECGAIRIYQAQCPSCRALWMWGIAGWIPGAVTALAGAHFVWICTEALEETVHRHLDELIKFTRGRDRELTQLIVNIQAEELSHLDEARAHISSRGTAARLLRQSISFATEAVIWLSTQDDSSRMAATIKRKKVA